MLPSPVLMICSANICRSPFAELYFRHRLQQAGEYAEVFSRGILEMHGKGVPEDGVTVAQEMGINATRHHATKLEAADLDRAALVLIMEKQHRQYLLQMRPQCVGKIFFLSQPTGGEEVPDPMAKGEDAFRESYQVIAHNIDAWLKRFGIA